MPHVSLAVDHETVMEPDPKAKYNVLLLHGEITDKNGEPRYRSEFGGAQVPETAVKANRWTYVALGHHHEAESLARNSWYAGGIERTSAFIWQEKRAKGFLVHDTDSGDTRHVEVETRALVDLPKIEAKGLSGAELDERIGKAVAKVEGGIAGKIVRLLAYDVPRQVGRELDHRRIREWKSEALHFHLDARPPEVRRRIHAGAPVRRLSLREQVETYLDKWTPNRKEIDRARLVTMGAEYIDRAAEGA
jgi:hypothetical protein